MVKVDLSNWQCVHVRPVKSQCGGRHKGKSLGQGKISAVGSRHVDERAECRGDLRLCEGEQEGCRREKKTKKD